MLLDHLALLGGHPLVGQGDDLGQSLPLVLGEVRSELGVPAGVGALNGAQHLFEDVVLVDRTILVVQRSGVGFQTGLLTPVVVLLVVIFVIVRLVLDGCVDLEARPCGPLVDLLLES